jgi:hypothetical protein
MLEHRAFRRRRRRHREPERSEGVAIQENVERLATLDRHVASLLAMTIPRESAML